MARKLIPLEEAAKTLGMSPDELNTMRENREIYGYRDGASWKFKPEDVERLAQEIAERGGSVSDSSSMVIDVGDDSDDGEDIVLLSEGEQAPAAGGSSTIIGALTGAQSAEDSDLKLGGSDIKLAGSGVELIGGSSTVISKPRAPSDSESSVSIRLADEDAAVVGGPPGSDLTIGGSDVLPVAAGGSGGDKGPGSDLTLFSETSVGEGIGSDVLGAGSESVFVGGSSGKIAGGAPGSDLTIGATDDDVFQLQDSAGSSSVRLADEPGSAGPGSDITISPGDSGINLIDPSDSGISLEEPLELSSADDESSFDLSSDSSGDSSGTLGDSAEFDSDAVMELQSEDEFLLTPLEESIDDESQDSGSQVIALDSDTDFEDASPTVMSPDAGGALLEPDEGGGLGADLGLAGAGLGLAAAPTLAAAPGGMMYAAGREQPYGILAMSLLTLSVIVLSLTGMMTFDLMRNIWSWDGAYTANSWLMDKLLGM